MRPGAESASRYCQLCILDTAASSQDILKLVAGAADQTTTTTNTICMQRVQTPMGNPLPLAVRQLQHSRGGGGGGWSSVPNISVYGASHSSDWQYGRRTSRSYSARSSRGAHSTNRAYAGSPSAGGGGGREPSGGGCSGGGCVGCVGVEMGGGGC